MLGFHRRIRSLIPVKELAKYDQLDIKAEHHEELESLRGDDEESNKDTRQQYKLLMVIYVVFMAEAIMATSLQPQLKMLIDESDDYCGNLSSSYLRSILDCAYAFGGTAGIFWGYLADRIGRRPVALGGLVGMTGCCVMMGLATDLASCAIFRFVAGLISSSVIVVALTMISDLSSSASERAKNVARLPLMAVFGSTGPIAQSLVEKGIEASGSVWQRFPTLSGQIACGSLIFAITIMAFVALKETLPITREEKTSDEDLDCEKAAFLGQHNSSYDDISSPSTSIRVFDFDSAFTPAKPTPISISQFLAAPSLLTLLSSFSILSLHSSIFDVTLPHLGHSDSQHGGMNLPCTTYLGLILLLIRFIAALTILLVIPRLVAASGLLTPYRRASMFFPSLYILTPLLALLVAPHLPLVTALSALTLLLKNILAHAAQVLVALLVLSAAPDAFSAGTVVGLMHVASLFRALAVAVSGTSFWLSSEVGVASTNAALWVVLAGLGGAGAAVGWCVKEGMRVEEDLGSDVLRWVEVWDVEEKEPAAREGL